MKKNTIANITNQSSDTLTMQLYARSYRAEFPQALIDKIAEKKAKREDFFVFVSHRSQSLQAEVRIFPFSLGHQTAVIVCQRMKRGRVWLYRKGEGELLEWGNWCETYKKLTPKIASPEEKLERLACKKETEDYLRIMQTRRTEKFMQGGLPDNVKSGHTDWDCFEYNQSMKVFNREFAKITKAINGDKK